MFAGLQTLLATPAYGNSSDYGRVVAGKSARPRDSRSYPKACYNFASGVNAMTIVVEIASRTGTRAYKEYDAPSVDAAIKEANRELRAYPEFWVTGFSVDRVRAVQRIPKEENLTAVSGDVSACAEPPWRAPFF